MTPMAEFHSPEEIEREDEALRDGKCPECGADLEIQDPAAHAASHWDSMTLKATRPTDAHRRAAKVANYGKHDAIDVTQRPAIGSAAAPKRIN
jgi:hypothetical protein